MVNTWQILVELTVAAGTAGAAFAAWRSAGAAARSAGAATKSAVATARAVEAQLTINQAQFTGEFLREYDKENMATALRTLMQFQYEINDKLGLPKRTPLDEDNIVVKSGYRSRIAELNAARKLVYNFYKRVFFLYKDQYITEKTLRVALETNGYTALIDVAGPLARLDHPDQLDTDLFKWLDEIQRIKAPEKD
jgi:hypothetical protein